MQHVTTRKEPAPTHRREALDRSRRSSRCDGSAFDEGRPDQARTPACQRDQHPAASDRSRTARLVRTSSRKRRDQALAGCRVRQKRHCDDLFPNSRQGTITQATKLAKTTRAVVVQRGNGDLGEAGARNALLSAGHRCLLAIASASFTRWFVPPGSPRDVKRAGDEPARRIVQSGLCQCAVSGQTGNTARR